MWLRAAVAASARAGPSSGGGQALRSLRPPLPRPCGGGGGAAAPAAVPSQRPLPWRQGLGAACRTCPERRPPSVLLQPSAAPSGSRAYASRRSGGGDDPYQALGLQRDASQDDIKAAYRKLALKWHPDRNPDNKSKAEDEFKRISKAYSLLSDTNQRAMYDRFGEDGGSGSRRGGAYDSGGKPMTEAEAAELFKQMFGNKTLDEIIREVEVVAKRQDAEQAATEAQLRSRAATLRAEADELEAQAVLQRLTNPLRSAQLIMLARKKLAEASQTDQAYQMSIIQRFNQRSQANWTLNRLRSMDPVHRERRRIARFVSWGVAIGALLGGVSWSGTFLLFLATSFLTRFMFALSDQVRK